MGDRFHISLDCAWCGQSNEEVYYAESSGFVNFTCSSCNKENGIVIYFKATKESIRLDDLEYDEY